MTPLFCIQYNSLLIIFRRGQSCQSSEGLSYYNITGTKRKRHLYLCSCHLQQHTGCVQILPSFSPAKTFSPHFIKAILCDTATELFIGQGCTNPENQVAVEAKFCVMSLNIWVLRNLRALYHPFGACSFEVALIKGKGKIHPRTGHEGPEGGGIEVWFYSFFNLGTRWR